jgi:hypothetical protein
MLDETLRPGNAAAANGPHGHLDNRQQPHRQQGSPGQQ